MALCRQPAASARPSDNCARCRYSSTTPWNTAPGVEDRPSRVWFEQPRAVVVYVLDLAEAEAVAHRLRGDVAAGPHHFGDPLGRHDLAGEQRPPEGGDVGRGGVDPAIPAAHDRQVEHVRPRLALDGQVAERSGPGVRQSAGTRCRACPRAHTPVRAPAVETGPR